MQEKVVFDTSIYIGIFNRGLYTNEINWFNKVTYLVHPVLHELWIGAKGKAEIRHLTRFGNTFVKSGRLVQLVVNIIKTIAHQNCKENNRLFQSKFI